MASAETLTPEQWATWVAQRHEWSGFLWLRWTDAEATLFFVHGRPRVHLSDITGWIEGEHALASISQRLSVLPPRWGRIPVSEDWIKVLTGLDLVSPAVPTDVIRPDVWATWAARRQFDGVAVLLGDTPGAWVVKDGHAHRHALSHAPFAVSSEGPAPGDGLLRLYRGRARTEFLPSGIEIPIDALNGDARVPVEAPAEAVPAPPYTDVLPPVLQSESPTDVRGDQISPSAPAESRETVVENAGSESTRRFRGDERFLLAPTADPAALTATPPEAAAGRDLAWLPMLDGSRSLDEIAAAAGVPPHVVDAVVAELIERRQVFRYTMRRRGA